MFIMSPSAGLGSHRLHHPPSSLRSHPAITGRWRDESGVMRAGVTVDPLAPNGLGGNMSTVTLPRIGSDGALVGDREAALYHYAVRCGEFSPATAAIELGLPVPEIREVAARLEELHLLRADGERFTPLDPEVATTTLISPLERAMYQRREQADRLRDRIGAITRPPSGEAAGSIDGLSGVAEIRGLFKLAAEVCRDSLVVLRPAHSDEDLLDELLAPCYGVLER